MSLRKLINLCQCTHLVAYHQRRSVQQVGERSAFDSSLKDNTELLFSGWKKTEAAYELYTLSACVAPLPRGDYQIDALARMESEPHNSSSELHQQTTEQHANTQDQPPLGQDSLAFQETASSYIRYRAASIATLSKTSKRTDLPLESGSTSDTPQTVKIRHSLDLHGESKLGNIETGQQ